MSIKQIELTKGLKAIVDMEDADLASPKWYANPRKGNRFYARRDLYTPPNRKCEYLHRLILERMIGRSLAKGEYADHINGDTLDNRRANLRIANPYQHLQNTGPRSNNTSGHRGVYYDKRWKTFDAYINVNGKRLYLGSYQSLNEAAQVYEEAADKYFGEFKRNPDYVIEAA